MTFKFMLTFAQQSQMVYIAALSQGDALTFLSKRYDGTKYPKARSIDFVGKTTGSPDLFVPVTYDPRIDVTSDRADVHAVAKDLAMRAGSWFDRSDLSLAEREATVASIIQTALRAYFEKGAKSVTVQA